VAALRPEKLRINGALAANDLRVQGVLRQAMFTGRELQLTVEVAGHGPIEALTTPLEANVALAPGQSVQLGFAPADLLFFAEGETGRRLS
jgi:iron(III) transport system ATP-binding protein